MHAGDPTRRSGVALQVGIGERREGGGRAEGREAQTAARGGVFLASENQFMKSKLLKNNTEQTVAKIFMLEAPEQRHPS